MLGFLRNRGTDPEEQLRKVLGEFELPAFPAIAHEVLALMRNDHLPGTKIAECLGRDPGLSVSVLRTVNSAAFACHRRVDDLTQAVAMIGMSGLESLVLSAAVSCSVPRPSAAFDTNSFWHASTRRAATARAIARELHPSTAAQSYTAALLQDMALPFLATQLADSYGDLLEHWRSSNDDLSALERQQYDWDHAEVASWICSAWEFPETLTVAIAGHHGADVVGAVIPDAVRLVSLIGEGDTSLDPLIAAGEQRGIAADAMQRIIQESFVAADELARAMSVAA